jgi:hypothetical protein
VGLQPVALVRIFCRRCRGRGSSASGACQNLLPTLPGRGSSASDACRPLVPASSLTLVCQADDRSAGGSLERAAGASFDADDLRSWADVIGVVGLQPVALVRIFCRRCRGRGSSASGACRAFVPIALLKGPAGGLGNERAAGPGGERVAAAGSPHRPDERLTGAAGVATFRPRRDAAKRPAPAARAAGF